MKISLAAVLDAAFYLVAGFFLSFIALNYFLPRPAVYPLAAAIAVGFTIFAVKFSAEKRNGKFASAEKEKKFNAVMSKLNLSDEKTVDALFEKALKAEGYATERKRGGVHIAGENKTAFFIFRFDGVTKTDVVKCFNKTDGGCTTEIYSESFSDAVCEFVARFGGKVILSDGKKAFDLLEKHKLLPKTDFELNDTQTKPNIDFRRLLDKKRAKNYLVFGLFFTVLSYFAPIKGYYLFFGAVFLTLALALRLFGKTAT